VGREVFYELLLVFIFIMNILNVLCTQACLCARTQDWGGEVQTAMGREGRGGEGVDGEACGEGWGVWVRGRGEGHKGGGLVAYRV
jgi:hypothetical protein